MGSSHAVVSASVQIVREMLHGIRESLRQGQEFDEIVEGLGNDHPRQRGYILGNMLVMEFLEDGRTLLAFAAFIGKGNQVESISRCIRLQVRLHGEGWVVARRGRRLASGEEFDVALGSDVFIATMSGLASIPGGWPTRLVMSRVSQVASCNRSVVILPVRLGFA